MHADFINMLTSYGFNKPPLGIKHGKIVRVAGPGDKPGKKNGWVVYFEEADGFAAGAFGSWKGTPEKVTWCSVETMSLTTAERVIYNDRIRQAQEEREAELLLIQEEAVDRAATIWQQAVECQQHAYLDRKGVKAFGIRQSRGDIVIPIIVDGAISSLQFIKPDGGKKFLSGGRVKGGWFRIEGKGWTVYVVEGYATGASVHMATGATVYVAFNAGNISEVVKVAKIDGIVVIAADDDQFGKDNAGRDKATRAGSEHGVEVIFPAFQSLDTKPVDFNDLHQLEGIERVKAILNKAPRLYQARTEQGGDSTLFNPPGMIGKIVDYYNATSGYNQPGFAVQTALAIGSLVCGRNFETSNANRSTLFLMIVGKSTTGKDHTKDVIENILQAAGCTELIGGEGYTSQAAVIEALRNRPRHITVMDEFSKYMRASQNKNSNANLADANTCLMKVISSPRAALRPKEYSNRGLSEDKKKEMNKPIMAPSITLMAMSVPDDLFGTIDIGSIKDGFWNRFIICVSDAQRSVRKVKPRIDVPREIVEWIEMVNVRRKYMVDNEQPDIPPMVSILEITPQAMAIYQEFNQYQIDRSNALDKFQLGDLVGRASEMALRISLIIALGRNPGSVIVDVEDITWSVEWVKYNMNILVDKLKMSVAGSEFEARKLESLKSIRESGDNGVSLKELNSRKPFSKYDPKQRREVIEALLEAEVIGTSKRLTGGKGQPAMIYVAIEGDE